MSSNVFNTDLFRGASNYQTILRLVSQLCDKLGFPGLDHVKLPWAQAVAFAGLSKTELKELPNSYTDDQLINVVAEHSKLFKYLETWAIYKVGVSSIVDVRKNEHIKFIETWMTTSSSFNVFYKRLKYVIDKMHVLNLEINKVWYGYVKDA